MFQKKPHKNKWNTRKSGFSQTASLVTGSVWLAAPSSSLSDRPVNPASKLAAVRLPCSVALIDDHLWELTWHSAPHSCSGSSRSSAPWRSVVKLCLLLPELSKPSVTQHVVNRRRHLTVLAGEQTIKRPKMSRVWPSRLHWWRFSVRSVPLLLGTPTSARCWGLRALIDDCI